MPPLPDAVGLVEDHPAQEAARPRLLEKPPRLLVPHHPLGAQVKEVDPPIPRLLVDRRTLRRHHRGVDPCGGEPLVLELVHLVRHQRLERRDHHRQATLDEGRKLEGQALAVSRGQEDEKVFPGERCRDRLTLFGFPFRLFLKVHPLPERPRELKGLLQHGPLAFPDGL